MSENKSGIYPTEDRVLVKPDELVVKVNGQKIEKIELAETVEDRHADAGVIGTVIAKGPDAWSSFRQQDLTGQKVMFARYVGLKTTGIDGKEYRLMYDRDIIAVVDPKLEMELA